MSADEDFDEDEEFVEGGPTRVAVVFETIFEARAPLRGALSRVAAHASARGRGRVFPPSPLFRWSASARSAGSIVQARWPYLVRNSDRRSHKRFEGRPRRLGLVS